MLLSPFLVSGNTRGREAPEPSLPLGYEDKAGHHCARPPPAGFTVCSSHITGGNAETWVMMWERAFPGADVGFPNRRTRGWVIEAHALSSHSKGNLHDGVRNSTTAGGEPVRGRRGFDERQNQGALPGLIQGPGVSRNSQLLWFLPPAGPFPHRGALAGWVEVGSKLV